jgi:hypothetical protein
MEKEDNTRKIIDELLDSVSNSVSNKKPDNSEQNNIDQDLVELLLEDKRLGVLGG